MSRDRRMLIFSFRVEYWFSLKPNLRSKSVYFYPKPSPLSCVFIINKKDYRKLGATISKNFFLLSHRLSAWLSVSHHEKGQVLSSKWKKSRIPKTKVWLQSAPSTRLWCVGLVGERRVSVLWDDVCPKREGRTQVLDLKKTPEVYLVNSFVLGKRSRLRTGEQPWPTSHLQNTSRHFVVSSRAAPTPIHQRQHLRTSGSFPVPSYGTSVFALRLRHPPSLR
jgi:hypothetical protein